MKSDGQGSISIPVTVASALLLVFTLFHPGTEALDRPALPTRDDHYEWLIMVYVAGDNDLGEDGEWGNAAVMDLDEMESSIPGSGVRVLALTDLLGPSNSHLYDIRPDSEEGLNSPSIPLSDLDPAWTDELNMGDPETLESFLEYSMTNTSFDRSMFVMWDHGSGWLTDGDISRPPATRGFAQDQYPQHTYMYLDDMRDAFMGAESYMGHFNFDIMAYDTCYMAMVEIFYQFSRWSDIAIGSMDEQPWYGYNYTFISSIDGIEPTGPEDLAGEVMDLFVAEYSSSSDTYHTAVITDVDMMTRKFIPALDDLSRSLFWRMYHLEVENNGLLDSVIGRAESVGIDSVDAGSLLQELIEADIDSNITELATRARGIYDDMVIDSWMKPMGRNPEGTGITIYLPSKELAFKPQYDGSYGFLNLTEDITWDETLREYQDPVERMRMNLSVIETGTGSNGYGILVDVMDMRIDPPAALEGAEIWMNGVLEGYTDSNGTYLEDEIAPGRYDVICRYGNLIDMDTIKALNRPPVPLIFPLDPSFGEGMPFLIYGNSSFDPDGDLITYSWDLDDSDGLNDTDSTGPYVSVMFDDDGTRTIRLTVNDSLTSSSMDMDLDVHNLPPVPLLVSPVNVEQGMSFTLNGSGSRDARGDMDTLEYRFIVNSEVIRDWSADPFHETSIDRPGASQITMEVRDKDGGAANQTMTVTITNLPPVSRITGPTMIQEDQMATYSANLSTDPSAEDDGLSYRWYLDGGDEPIGSGEFLSLNFTEAGEHILDLVVHDGEPGGSLTLSNRSTLRITVENALPVAVIRGPDSVNESEIFVLDGLSSTDTASDIGGLIFFWDTNGDGDFDTEGSTVSLDLSSEGTELISLKVIDDDGEFSIADHYVQVENLPPDPEFIIPGSADEDEIIPVTNTGEWDTEGDIPILSVSWFVDDMPVSDEMVPAGLTISTSGKHEIKVVVQDDQGSVGSFSSFINITNPVPQVTLSRVPSKIMVGQEFTVEGYRTTDNPSDMAALQFIWYLDGERLDLDSKNATFKFDSPGKREIGLEVVDDDGDGFRASLNVTVVDDPLLLKIVDAVFSAFGLVILLVMFVLLFVLVYRVNTKMGELKPPDNGPKEDEPDPEEDEELEDDLKEAEVFQEEMGEGTLDEEEDLDETILDLRRGSSELDEGSLRPPDLVPPELPGPPLIGGADVPEPDHDLLEM